MARFSCLYNVLISFARSDLVIYDVNKHEQTGFQSSISET